MLRRLFKRKKPLDRVFHDIYYRSDAWRHAETGSGPGSTLESTTRIRAALPTVFRSYSIQSIVDAPCGDCNWISHVPLDGIRYTGIDIIEQLIRENRIQFPDRHFKVADITKDELPTADLVLSRDCFIHLPNQLILAALANFKKTGYRYLLTNTYDFIETNKDIRPGEFRMLNLQLAPFNLSAPLLKIEEEYTSGYPDKQLALWQLNEY